MVFRPSKISLLSLQKIIQLIFVPIVPVIVCILTDNLYFAAFALIISVIAVYFWSVSLFLQTFTIKGSELVFYDPGSHRLHDLSKARRIQSNTYTFNLSSIKNIFVSVRTNGNMRFIEFFDEDISKSKIDLWDLDRETIPLIFSIVGIWTERDIKKLLEEIKKQNPHMNEARII